ncbi:MAG: hydroxylamine reductase [Candidatus Krumholzibacteriota bacterium]|nr:hydroxylamine reductase [Candidatus Krumholzibacteriota bacterium]
MFCFQCQETAGNAGCTKRGVCGKDETTANMQDLLLYVLRGVAVHAERLDQADPLFGKAGRFTMRALFATITNANFSADRIAALVRESIALRDELAAKTPAGDLPEAARWRGASMEEFLAAASGVGVLATDDEDARSLRELLVYGLKGIAAYADHAAVLGREDPAIYAFAFKALASLTRETDGDALFALVMEAGSMAVTTMALLDAANTAAYGEPAMTTVDIGVRGNPGILVSGHDLHDLARLLDQTDGTGVDVYTHGEMLPAQAYPAFRTFAHFAGNYGGSWYRQDKEFASFNGPILMTTNCITPVRDEYRDRIYTTGAAGYPGVRHIPAAADGEKDFSAIVEQAKGCASPTEIETGSLTVGFGHGQLEKLAKPILEAVKSGAVKRFVVMAGCDGRQKGRSYFTDVATALPPEAVILTAGCAKYRYNKLGLGETAGLPRVIDAGQCNDSYSLAVIALKLKEILELDDINDLPISYDIAWYEQKAVAVLLALLALGVKNIRLGPTLPAFLSPNVATVLVEKFGIRPTGEAASDAAAIMEGR